MAKSDVEMVVGQVIRVPVAVAADRILSRGKSILGAMRGPLERRAKDQGVALKRFRLVQDRANDCCVLEALVVDAPEAVGEEERTSPLPPSKGDEEGGAEAPADTD